MILSDELVNLGFERHFPQVSFLTKDNIHVQTMHKVTFKDKVLDANGKWLTFCNKITIFNLPDKKEYCFKSDETVLNFIKLII